MIRGQLDAFRLNRESVIRCLSLRSNAKTDSVGAQCKAETLKCALSHTCVANTLPRLRPLEALAT